MNDFIFYADRLLSVANPYVSDDFVASHHKKVTPEEMPALLNRYHDVSKNNVLLKEILNAIGNVNKGPVDVCDVGVFMGSFSTAVYLCAKYCGVQTSINAYEVNPLVIASILKNWSLYDVTAALHWVGIGERPSSMKLVVNERSAIGASLKNSVARPYGDCFSCMVDVKPLSEILQDSEKVGFVKLDIEGYEVVAFSSIADDVNRLNNVFIVEYAPWQGEVLCGEILYSRFLLSNFNVFNIGNWGWFAEATPLQNEDSLKDCFLGNGGKNTDLLLIPKSFSIPLLSRSQA